ncbi:HRDC domain-containing protein [Corynebacterium sp. H128]|uniref:HRDC domain-containing protein n=1 Tax=Corynebacterium sp. H128 TaxID=3133427 RepID=UPI0030963181
MDLIPLLQPRDGLPAVAHSPTEFQTAAAQLAQGRGPIAIDTERASDFRFDDRAFLVQLRRQDAGTILVAPEPDRSAFSAAFAPVLNGREWVLHAASSDLPALKLLGLTPGVVFDTELSGRLLGFPKVNLGALIAEVLGFELEKSHGNEDWSTWPLPESWLNYAALDVELLLELADALTELLDAEGKLGWLEQECAYIVANSKVPHPTWTDLKGIGRLKKPEQLLIARSLWERRQAVAWEKDRAPHRILANKALVELAYSLPTSTSAIRAALGRRGSNPEFVARLAQTMRQARRSPKATWPKAHKRDFNITPAPRTLWSSSFPEAQEALAHARELLAELAAETNTPVENLLQPAMLREVVWHSVITRRIKTSAELDAYLAQIGARPWQRELCSSLLAEALV